MAVHQVGSGLDGVRPPRRVASPTDAPAAAPTDAPDSFDRSARLDRVRALIDSLIRLPTPDDAAVSDAARSLEAGELESRAALEAAAESLLSEG